MNKNFPIVVLCSLFLIGCTPEKSSPDDVSNLYDLNSDGVQDATIENTDDGYYELVDRNFDDKVDESHFYDLNDKIQKSKIDDDFDGYLETEVFYRYGSTYLSSADVNKDGLQDIFYFYEAGTLKRSVRYYVSNNIDKAMIGTIMFKFDYPSKEVIIETKLSQKQFIKENSITRIKGN